ncbi:MAG: phosphoglucomutase/phosphomannomutase family protein [Clostridiales bacterium]|nr:phosphoglucomutase/phosphomannomutase family protein [Clostridiales bacterium]
MIKFGTGGWRAVIGDGFTKANVQRLTAALARKMKDEGVEDAGFVVGYDRRFLSLQASQWACEVMAGEGIACRLVDRDAPTPLIMFTVKYYGMHYGMAVTASHNPAIYNGVKVFVKGGRDADETVTADIEKYIAALKPEDIRTVPYEEALRAGLVEMVNPQNAYLDSIIRGINMDAIRSRGLKIVLDPMYGVSKTSLQTILLTARCDVDTIHDRHDTLFGGRLPAPNVETLGALKSRVIEHGSDIGIATDGDADRLGIIDDRGNFVHPNQILVILYYYLIKYKGWHGPAVRNIATTHLLDKVARAFGEQCYEVPVGFKYVSSRMLETNAVIGGESSGGLTVRGHIQGKDGIYAASLLVEMLAVTGKKLSEIYDSIVDEYGRLFMAERDYRFTQERKQEIMKLLMEDKKLPDFPDEIDRVSYVDGCKVYFKNDGWIIARFSGTEPLLRIFCEMPERVTAEAACDIMKDFLKL